MLDAGGGLARRRVAVLLPPREAFAPAATGAIGLLVRMLNAEPDGFAPLVLGPAPPTPAFTAPLFRALVPSFWPPAPFARRYAAAALAALRAEPPDLVEVHNRPDIALFLAGCLPHPVGLVLHNDPQSMPAARSAAERAALLGRLAGVATVSRFLRGRLLEGLGVDEAAVALLPNCLDLDALPPPAEPREALILFAGRVVADKGADSFVTACAAALPALPGWRAEMIGADRFGPDSPETPFLRALRPRAEAAGVVLRGYRPHPEVLTAMARAAIVVVPSRWPEPFGLTALEAMASGAALVCSDRGGLPEVAGGAALVIDPDDPAATAAALIALARDPDRRAALGAAGVARARRFDRAAGRAALAAWRERLLAAGGRARR